MRKVTPAVSVPSDVCSFHLFSFIFAFPALISVTQLTPVKGFSGGLSVSLTSSSLWKICTPFSKEFRRWGVLIDNFCAITSLWAAWAVFSAFFHLLQGLESAWNLSGSWSDLGEDRGHARKADTTSSFLPPQFSVNLHFLCIPLCQRTILCHGLMCGIRSLCISIHSCSKHSVHSPGAKPSEQHPPMQWSTPR